MFTGGSAYGLDAAAGVMRWMEERGRGFPVGAGRRADRARGGRVRPRAARPVRRAADRRRWRTTRPTRRASTAMSPKGRSAPARARRSARSPARRGAMKGGFGCAVDDARRTTCRVGAMVVVNAFGDVRDARGEIIAGARATERRVRRHAAACCARATSVAQRVRRPRRCSNTTLAVVAASAPLVAVELAQLARAAGAALFRRITPCGIVVRRRRRVRAVADGTANVARVGRRSSIEIARRRGARERDRARGALARGRDGIPGLADAHGTDTRRRRHRGDAVLYSATVRAPIAPMHGEPRIASQMISQQLAGHASTSLDEDGDWVRARGADGYEGWMHAAFSHARRDARRARAAAVAHLARLRRRRRASGVTPRAAAARAFSRPTRRSHRARRSSRRRLARALSARRRRAIARSAQSSSRRRAICGAASRRGAPTAPGSCRACSRCTACSFRATRGSRRSSASDAGRDVGELDAGRSAVLLRSRRPARHARRHRARRAPDGASRARPRRLCGRAARRRQRRVRRSSCASDFSFARRRRA